MTESSTELPWNEVPAPLKPFVAQPDDHATEIVEPLYVDWREAATLAAWHPQEIGADPYRFKHVAYRDKSGKEVVKVQDFEGDWDNGMREVMKKLRFYHHPQDGDVPEHLAHTSPALPFGNWTVTRWIVTITSDFTTNRKIHQDVVTWKKANSEEEFISVMSWLPYRP